MDPLVWHLVLCCYGDKLFQYYSGLECPLVNRFKTLEKAQREETQHMNFAKI